MIHFGEGHLFFLPSADQADQTPLQIGRLLEVDLTMDAALVKVSSQFQYPVKFNRTMGRIMATAKMATLDNRLITELYFGNFGSTLSAGALRTVVNNTVTMTGLTYTPTPPSGAFAFDLGLVYDDTGLPLVLVTNTPGPGQYSISGGTYTVNSADDAVTLRVSYAYQSATGTQLQLANQLMQFAPRFGALLRGEFGGQSFSAWFKACSASSLGLLTPVDKYDEPNFKFEVCADNSNNVGVFSFD